MAKKIQPHKSSETPKPVLLPEEEPMGEPEEPIPAGDDPDIVPDEDPFENPPPFEIPEPGEGP